MGPRGARQMVSLAGVLWLNMISNSHTQVCYLCGQRLGDTRDHVFPRLLFPKGKAPTNLITLPACAQCNNKLSKDEEVFQQLILSGRALDTDVAREVWETKVRPNLKDKNRGLRQRVLRQTEIRKSVTFWGQQLHNWPVLNVDSASITRVLSKTVRGLYYLECRERLPDDVKIEVWFSQDQYERLIVPQLMPYARKTEVAKDILTYWRVIAADNPAASMTWFVFYHWNVFCVATVPPEVRSVSNAELTSSQSS